MPRKAANGRRYTDAEKMIAVQTVRASGGNVSDEAMRNIRVILKAPALDSKTVVSWLKIFSTSTESTGPKNESSVTSSVEVPSLDFQRETAYAIVEHTFRKYATRANNQPAVDATEGKDAAKVMADMAKLMQLLQGLPTDIIELTERVVKAAEQRKEDPRKIMEALINDYENEVVSTEKD